MSGFEESRDVPVWDLATRIWHWAVVVLFLVCWWSGETERFDWHLWSGYGVFALILFRIVWGWTGSTSSRFNHFVRSPATLLTYARMLVSKTSSPSVGHNPIGGWSVILLLSFLAAQVFSGLFAVDVDGVKSGPLSHWVSFGLANNLAEFHLLLFNIGLALIALHIAAVIFYVVYKHENLFVAMLNGKKRLPGSLEEELHFVSPWYAFVVVLASMAVVGLIVTVL